MNNVLYLTDNVCFYKRERAQKIYKLFYTDQVLKFGKVADEDLFVKQTNKLLTQKKLINIFVNQNLTVIINDTYTKIDKEILKNCLEKLNFRNILFKEESSILDLNKNNYISVNNEYIIIYYQNEYLQKVHKLIPSNFFKEYKQLINYINNELANKKRIYLYGNNDVNKMYNFLQASLEVYQAESPETYVLLVNTKWTLENWFLIIY